MRASIESVNFEPSETLNNYIVEKSQLLIGMDEDVLFIEFHLSFKKGDFICTLVLVVA